MKINMKIIISLIGLVFLGLVGFWWYQSNQNNPKPEIFSKNGIALEGYDPITFFEESEPVLGKKDLSLDYKGVEWRFTTSDNLSEFKSRPESYIPKYGGYCAYGTSNGYKAPTKIETWTVYQGKLYFNYNMKVKQKWSSDKDNYIKKADKYWQTFDHKN